MEREHLENLGVDGRIILNCIFKRWDGGHDWIDAAQNMGKQQTPEYAVKELWVPQTVGNLMAS
jgi:hypothetical protein